MTDAFIIYALVAIYILIGLVAYRYGKAAGFRDGKDSAERRLARRFPMDAQSWWIGRN